MKIFENIIKIIIICSTILVIIWFMGQAFKYIGDQNYKTRFDIQTKRDHCIAQTKNIMYCWQIY